MRISDWSSDVCSSDLPGNLITCAGADAQRTGVPLTRMPQMPSYHLVRDKHMGITLINIGVGPSNAKTITDHVAVLRPSAWLMLGHCAGLRTTPLLGHHVPIGSEGGRGGGGTTG